MFGDFGSLFEKLKDNYYLLGAAVLVLAVVGYFLYNRYYAAPAPPAMPEPQPGPAPGPQGPEEEVPQMNTDALAGVHVSEAIPAVQEAGLQPQVIPEGSPVTKDYVSDRVRLFIDESETVVSAMQG